MILRCLYGLFAEKRFMLLFGVVYVFFMGALITSQGQQGSDTETEILLSPRWRNQPQPSTSTAKVLRAMVRRTQPPNPPPPPNVKKTLLPAPVNNPVGNTSYDCARLPAPVFLQAGERPLTALTSFPGSGNTWARVLISSLTGYITGDIYRDGAFAKTPGFSFRKDDTVIAVKTHHPFWDDNNGDDPNTPKGRYWERAVVLVRHPLDATVSVYNYFRMRSSHTQTATLDKFIKGGKVTKGEEMREDHHACLATLMDMNKRIGDGRFQEWNKWAHDQIRNWGRSLHYWVNQFKGPILIVFYEDLKANLREQLILINDFLGLELNQARLECTVISQAQTKFKRDKQVDKRIIYDTSMLNEAEVVLDTVRELLTKNYTHPVPFRIPNNYATHLVRENFSIKPES